MAYEREDNESIIPSECALDPYSNVYAQSHYEGSDNSDDERDDHESYASVLLSSRRLW